MKPFFSKLLIHDLVVPCEGADWRVTSMDWLMLCLGAVRERSEDDWRALIDGVDGLHIEKIWTVEPGTESVIEVVRYS